MKTIQLPVDINDAEYSDVTIKLVDASSEITMHLHRVILGRQNLYFKKLFSFSDNIHKHEFSIVVDDVQIASILIKSFYGEVTSLDSIQLLKMTKCKSFFCIDICASDLYNICIPPEYFDLLLEVIELPEIKLDNRLFFTIKKNLPIAYDMSRLTTAFIKMLDVKSQIISTSYDKTLKLWDVETGECLRTYTGHTCGVMSITLKSDNTKIVSICSNNIKIWDLESEKYIQTYTGHTETVKAVAWSYNNRQLVSTSHDKTLKLWDVESGMCIRTYTGHTHYVMAVAWTSDNSQIVSASADKTLKLWDVATGFCIRTYTDHQDWVNSVAISPDDLQIISSSHDKTFKIWDNVFEHLVTIWIQSLR
jgi:WD40 repeat protein